MVKGFADRGRIGRECVTFILAIIINLQVDGIIDPCQPQRCVYLYRKTDKVPTRKSWKMAGALAETNEAGYHSSTPSATAP